MLTLTQCFSDVRIQLFRKYSDLFYNEFVAGIYVDVLQCRFNGVTSQKKRLKNETAKELQILPGNDGKEYGSDVGVVCWHLFVKDKNSGHTEAGVFLESTEQASGPKIVVYFS